MSQLNLPRVLSRTPFAKRKFFYNDKVEIYRPFNNLVKVNFNRDRKIGNLTITQDYVKSYFTREYGDVTGVIFLDSSNSAFLSFASADDKRDALLQHRLNKAKGCLFSSQIEDFIVDGSHEDARRPFKHILVASFRPTVHSPSRIQAYLSQFGTTFGQEVIKCPYDKDRKFMYFCYHDLRSYTSYFKETAETEQHKVSIPDVPLNLTPREGSQHPEQDVGPGKEYIEGDKVSHPHLILEKLPRHRVYLYLFRGYEPSQYAPVIHVRTNQDNPDLNLVKQYLDTRYGDVTNISRESDFDASEARVEFANPISSFKIFYARTQYGRKTEDIPGTDYRLELTLPGVATWTQREHALRVLNTPNIPDNDVMGYWNEFLDLMNCNPGIVGASRMNDNSYELYFANPWHTANVANIMILNRALHSLYVDFERPYFEKWLRTGSKISRSLISEN